MKKIDWSKADRIKKLVDTEIPFKEVSLPGNVTARLYWRKGGAYGWQVCIVLYGWKEDSYSYTTGGCGYCKEGAALDRLADLTGKDIRGRSYGNKLDSHHIGGNFYKVPVKDWMKAK